MSQISETGAPPARLETGLAPGMAAERDFIVGEGDTAQAIGGDFPVLATAILINWVELVASDLIHSRSEGSLGSFGTRVDIRHTAAAAPGDRVTVAVSVKSSIFQMIRFAVTVTQSERKTVLLSGEHDRALARRPV